MENVKVILEKGEYALIKRGETLEEYAVVRNLNKADFTWAYTVSYYECKANGCTTHNEAEQLARAVDCLRVCTEKDYIPRCRLEELATLFKDGLMEDDEETAMEYFEENCEMTESEMEYFGIVESEDED
jgi:hypothetical protein